MVAVLGAGSFGTTIANILAEQNDVLLYSRREEVVMQVNEQHQCRNTPMSHRVTATTDLADICKRCTLIFPIVPSQSFRALMRDCAPYLHPYHILIHGTKGFDVTYPYVEGERIPKWGGSMCIRCRKLSYKRLRCCGWAVYRVRICLPRL